MGTGSWCFTGMWEDGNVSEGWLTNNVNALDAAELYAVNSPVISLLTTPTSRPTTMDGTHGECMILTQNNAGTFICRQTGYRANAHVWV